MSTQRQTHSAIMRILVKGQCHRKCQLKRHPIALPLPMWFSQQQGLIKNCFQLICRQQIQVAVKRINERSRTATVYRFILLFTAIYNETTYTSYIFFLTIRRNIKIKLSCGRLTSGIRIN